MNYKSGAGAGITILKGGDKRDTEKDYEID